MSQDAIGRKGRKNCRVTGKTSDERSNVATANLTNPPGTSIMQSENSPRIARIRYWPSYIVHRCDCNDLRVSVGEKEVWREVMAEAGDCRVRIFERSFRRNLCGTRTCIERHGSEIFALVKTPCGRSVQVFEFCIAPPVSSMRADWCCFCAVDNRLQKQL